MENNLSVFVDLSPILLIMMAIIVVKGIENDKLILTPLFAILTSIYIWAFPSLLASGHGDMIVGIIMQCLLLLLAMLFSFIWIKGGLEHFNVVMALFGVWYIILSIVGIYLRLKYEKILQLRFIDEILNADYIKIISYVLENEWVKGISIGALGTVIGGLMLDKIKKSK